MKSFVTCFCVNCALSALVFGELTYDRFGIRELQPTIVDGREWFANWDVSRVIPPHTIDPYDPLFRNEDKELSIGKGFATILPGQTRLMVLTPKGPAGSYTAPEWRNVEMTIYVRCGERTQTPSYQALVLSARSGERHNDAAPCEGTSYHASARFDASWGFKKEIWHTGGYTQLRPTPAPRPWQEIPKRKWIGLKLLCRNVDSDQHVRLEAFLEENSTNEWRTIVDYTDVGDWPGAQLGCDRPINYILADARPAVYFRTDYVEAEAKCFSVREIAPLP